MRPSGWGLWEKWWGGGTLQGAACSGCCPASIRLGLWLRQGLQSAKYNSAKDNDKAFNYAKVLDYTYSNIYAYGNFLDYTYSNVFNYTYGNNLTTPAAKSYTTPTTTTMPRTLHLCDRQTDSSDTTLKYPRLLLCQVWLHTPFSSLKPNPMAPPSPTLPYRCCAPRMRDLNTACAINPGAVLNLQALLWPPPPTLGLWQDVHHTRYPYYPTKVSHMRAAQYSSANLSQNRNKKLRQHFTLNTTEIRCQHLCIQYMVQNLQISQHI